MCNFLEVKVFVFVSIFIYVNVHSHLSSLIFFYFFFIFARNLFLWGMDGTEILPKAASSLCLITILFCRRLSDKVQKGLNIVV